MRLAAIYVLEHYLFEKEQTINLVGEYYYSFKKNENKIVIDRVKNENYIEKLHYEGISEVSAIVGANGSGKTTLFSIIDKGNDDTKVVFVYENELGELITENRTGKIDENGNITDEDSYEIYFKENKKENKINTDVPVLYYSPIPDQDLSRFRSTISKTAHFKSTLSEYHLDNVERAIMLMTDEVVDEIRSVYPELPLYDSLNIQAKPLFKRDLRNVYGGFKEEGDLERTQKWSLDKLWDQYKNEEKEHLTHDNKDLFKDIEVNIFSYLIIDGTSMQTSFNGNYEVSFEEIIKEKDFHKKLRHFFFHKIAYIDKYIYLELRKRLRDDNYESLLSAFDGIDYNEKLNGTNKALNLKLSEIKESSQSLPPQELIDLITKEFKLMIEEGLKDKEFEKIRDNLSRYIQHLTKYDVQGSYLVGKVQSDLNEIEIGLGKSFDFLFEVRSEIIDQLKSGVKRSIRLFNSISVFYKTLDLIVTGEGFKLEQGSVIANLKEAASGEFKRLIEAYKKVIQEFSINYLIEPQLIEFRPNKRLSFGEKSLINLFSGLYEFTIRKNDHLRRKKNYILLLDEADLGFHPLWKKKYVSVISKVIPVIFSKLNEDVDYPITPELEKRKVQIIISTHDPLALSDIPNYNIIYVDKLENGKSNILNVFDNQGERPNQSFGANVHDLLAHSFFLEDGLIGDFAKSKIQETIQWLNNKDRDTEKKGYFRSLINLIDEPLVQRKLSQMYDEVFHDELELSLIEKQIEKLEKLRDKLNRDDISES